jgi:hypothetical protein
MTRPGPFQALDRAVFLTAAMTAALEQPEREDKTEAMG